MHLISPLLLMFNFMLHHATVPALKQVHVGQAFTLKLHEQVQLVDSLSGTTVTLTLASLTDNRCPVDVLCIQAGEVVVQLEAKESLDSAAKLFTVTKASSLYSEKGDTTATELLGSFSPSVRFGKGYELVLLQALPYPQVETASKANEVRLRVQHVPAN